MEEKIEHLAKKIHHFSTTQMIAGGFLAAIIIGAFLLMLPISSRDGTITPAIDAVFTATSSVCVTGLVTVSTLNHWSFFGQIIILLLIQFGGWGIITFTTTIFLFLKRRITLRERLLIQEAYNLNTLRGLVRLTIKIIKGTLIIEGIGAFLYGFVFIPEYGFLQGIWKSIFNSISAFCNAGMDILGDRSLELYRDNILVNAVTMLLIILGGIGFPVWWDIVRVAKVRINDHFRLRKSMQKLRLHTKLVLVITACLIFGGCLIIFLFEYQNPKTIGDLPLGNKIMASLFQSVTTRTAGFATIPQQNFTKDSSFISLLLMFIGGSPSGTAGGVKTVTIGLLILSVISIIRGKDDVDAFHKRIQDSYVKKSLAIIFVSLFVMITSIIALSMVEKVNFLDLVYEVVSALGTVGLSRGITASMSTFGRIVLIITMYLGRIGPITMALAFNVKRRLPARHYPEEDIMVG